MKGLLEIPSVSELASAYDLLAKAENAARVSVSDLARFSQWARFDPRLGEQLVLILSQIWKQVPPLQLRDPLLAVPWPAVFGVLLEQAALLVPKAERRKFRIWSELVMFEIPKATGIEQFFIGLDAFAGKRMIASSLRPLKMYTRWGYLGTEVLINKESSISESRRKTLMPATSRRIALDDLLKKRRRIQLQDYMNALDGRVSRRQAEYDLRKHPKLVAHGNTKARFYRCPKG